MITKTQSAPVGATVSFATVQTPIGPLLLAATKKGIVRVGFANGQSDAMRSSVLADLAASETDDWSATLARANTQLDEYFDGARDSFDIGLDWSLTTGFREQVQRRLTSIPYAHTMSYGELARAIGNPNAVRAVATGCATNPLPIIVPCHRVVRTDGQLGGYLGGLEAKRLLLDLERA